MARDIDNEILLEEAFAGRAVTDLLRRGESLARGGGERVVRDHDAAFVLVGVDVADERGDFFDAELVLGEELYPDGAAVGDGAGVGWRWRGRVFDQHVVAGAGRELHLCATIFSRLAAWFFDGDGFF